MRIDKCALIKMVKDNGLVGLNKAIRNDPGCVGRNKRVIIEKCGDKIGVVRKMKDRFGNLGDL
jgi:hypothetical protein